MIYPKCSSAIIAEQPPYILNLKQAKAQRKRRQAERAKGNFIRALVGLVSSGKANNFSLEIIFDRAFALLKKYLRIEPQKTMLALIGKESFTVDDVVKKVSEITLKQYLHLSDDFEEIDVDIFHLKTTTKM